jgi:hypothetical protein
MKSLKSFVFEFSNATLRCFKDDKEAQVRWKARLQLDVLVIR